MELEKCNLFATPESVSALHSWIDAHNANERAHLYTVMGMTWNLAADLIAKAEADDTVTLAGARTYDKEFGTFELLYQIPEGFEDNSWHNDAMPCWINQKYGLKLWINYPDPDDREVHIDTEFAVYQYDLDDEEMANSFEVIYEGNSWSECVDRINNLRC